MARMVCSTHVRITHIASLCRTPARGVELDSWSRKTRAGLGLFPKLTILYIDVIMMSVVTQSACVRGAVQAGWLSEAENTDLSSDAPITRQGSVNIRKRFEPRGLNMEQPNNSACLSNDAHLSLQPDGLYVPSTELVQLLVIARSDYDWPSGTGAAKSQQTIIDLESVAERCMATLTADDAHRIIVDVSKWAGNNAISHQKIINATPNQKKEMQTALSILVTHGHLDAGLDALCELPGIRLVIASKIYRFCQPRKGAALDRHASYFFNSLPVIGNDFATNFTREWSTGRRSSSRLAIYSNGGYVRNRDEYILSYLPLLASIANWLNSSSKQYRCAATNQLKEWRPTDVEMAAYYWWACNGAR